jgi:hypothetical protein
LARFEDGDVGAAGEETQLKKVIDAFMAYTFTEYTDIPKGYDVKAHIHEKHIVTFTYLHRRLCNTKPFKKSGYAEPGEILRRTLKTLIERGDIIEIPKSQMAKDHGFTGVAYMLANAKTLHEEWTSKVR